MISNSLRLMMNFFVDALIFWTIPGFVTLSSGTPCYIPFLSSLSLQLFKY